MITKRSKLVTVATAIVLSFVFIATSCNTTAEKTETKDTLVTPVDTSKAAIDTSFGDTAETRPVKTPD
jgi:putative copper export protein